MLEVPAKWPLFSEAEQDKSSRRTSEVAGLARASSQMLAVTVKLLLSGCSGRKESNLRPRGRPPTEKTLVRVAEMFVVLG